MSDETAITDDYLDRLQAICGEGTFARNEFFPFVILDSANKKVAVTNIENPLTVGHDVLEEYARHAAAFAESRTALPLLIAEVRRLRGEVEAANDFQLIATNALFEAGRAAGLAAAHIEACAQIPLSTSLTVSSLLRNAVKVADILPNPSVDLDAVRAMNSGCPPMREWDA